MIHKSVQSEMEKQKIVASFFLDVQAKVKSYVGDTFCRAAIWV
jgi:hypothetical protein